MKKLFYLFAVVAVVASLASCNKKDEADSKFFKITVSNIEAASADLSIVPADTTVYYSVALYYAEDLVKDGAEALAAEYVAYLDSLAGEYSVKALIEYYYIRTGTLSTPVEGLTPNTEYAFVAFEVTVNGDHLTLGKGIASATFKTKELVIKDEVDLGVLDGGGFEDYRTEDGSYLAYATDLTSYDVTLNIYDMDCVGNFTEADLEPEYSYIWTSAMNSEYAESIVTAQLESKLAGAEEATISGWVVASNYIKYKFSFTHPTVESGYDAPKKAAARKANELKPAKLHVIR